MRAWLFSSSVRQVLPDSMSVMRLHFRLHTVLLPGERKKSSGVKDCSVASLASVNSLRCWWRVACVQLSVIKVMLVHFHFSIS